MKSQMLNKMKIFGIVITIGSTISFVILLLLSLQIATAGHLKCSTVDQYCSIIGHVPYESFAGLGALALLIAAGAWMAVKSHKEIIFESSSSSHLSETAKRLTGDTKIVYQAIVDSEGTTFQNDIINKTNFSKVKVSRILDRLEVAGLIERRRRGMSNLIILKK